MVGVLLICCCLLAACLLLRSRQDKDDKQVQEATAARVGEVQTDSEASRVTALKPVETHEIELQERKQAEDSTMSLDGRHRDGAEAEGGEMETAEMEESKQG